MDSGHITEASNKIQGLRPQTQQEPSCLAYGAGLLGHLHRTSLVVWDTSTWTQKAVLPIENPKGIGALSDGSLLVMEAPTSLNGQVRIRRIRPSPTSTVEYQGALNWPPFGWARIFPALSTEEFLLISPGNHSRVYKCTLKLNGTVFPNDNIPISGDAYHTLTSIAPGSVGCLSSDTLLKLSFPLSRQSFTLPSELSILHHIASGPKPDQVWVSDANQSIFLLTLENPCRILQKIRPVTDLVYNLHAADEYAAVLLITTAQSGIIKSLTLSLYHQDGRERWHARLPIEGIRNYHSIQVGPHFVALAGEEALFVWDIKNGSPLTLPAMRTTVPL